MGFDNTVSAEWIEGMLDGENPKSVEAYILSSIKTDTDWDNGIVYKTVYVEFPSGIPHRVMAILESGEWKIDDPVNGIDVKIDGTPDRNMTVEAVRAVTTYMRSPLYNPEAPRASEREG